MITSAFVGVVVGTFARKLNVQEGDFGKAKVAVFAIANVVAHVIGWVVVAPVLDILIYAEPAKSICTGCICRSIQYDHRCGSRWTSDLAYTKTIAKKDPWIRNKISC